MPAQLALLKTMFTHYSYDPESSKLYYVIAISNPYVDAGKITLVADSDSARHSTKNITILINTVKRPFQQLLRTS